MDNTRVGRTPTSMLSLLILIGTIQARYVNGVFTFYFNGYKPILCNEKLLRSVQFFQNPEMGGHIRFMVSQVQKTEKSDL